MFGSKPGSDRAVKSRAGLRVSAKICRQICARLMAADSARRRSRPSSPPKCGSRSRVSRLWLIAAGPAVTLSPGRAGRPAGRWAGWCRAHRGFRRADRRRRCPGWRRTRTSAPCCGACGCRGNRGWAAGRFARCAPTPGRRGRRRAGTGRCRSGAARMRPCRERRPAAGIKRAVAKPQFEVHGRGLEPDGELQVVDHPQPGHGGLLRLPGGQRVVPVDRAEKLCCSWALVLSAP